MDEHAPYQYFEDVNWGLLRLWNGRRGLRVLDAGCGFATTSARIEKLGNEVTGIEESAVACEVAAKRISRIVNADLQQADLGDEQFDVLIFADVLEHVPWPAGVLKRYLRWLKPDGSVIVSLPNVGLWSVRFAHLFGRWEYEETGVLDRTHLRFFTRKSARWLLGSCRLSPIATTYNPGLVRPFVPLAKKMLSSPRPTGAQPADALLNSRSYQLYLKTAYPIERAVASLWPGMLAFQMIFEAKRTP
ncbi:MAG TPA: class I SAM-dependent methyltransferase [Thermoanaerobaculia bacterium]|jgi:SAM-dependent methyltransferase|nr:class I SAM-dependent methyltransferase [Thermoanaerobaculia bacterium]